MTHLDLMKVVKSIDNTYGCDYDVRNFSMNGSFHVFVYPDINKNIYFKIVDRKISKDHVLFSLYEAGFPDDFVDNVCKTCA